MITEAEIKSSLVALLASIKAGNGPHVVAEMAKLDEFLERDARALHPQLVHFLQNRSYAKALLFLGGETEIPVGACGGRVAKA